MIVLKSFLQIFKNLVSPNFTFHLRSTDIRMELLKIRSFDKIQIHETGIKIRVMSQVEILGVETHSYRRTRGVGSDQFKGQGRIFSENKSF